MSGRIEGIEILGTGYYVPEKVLTNKELESRLDTTDEWIVTRTGIRERRIASPEETTLSMAYYASEKAIQRAKIEPGEIGLIIVATATPDMIFPATAAQLQEKIGATNAGAFDLSIGCTGFIYALVTGALYTKVLYPQKVLVVGAEKLSAIVDWQDRSTAVLFGDGAGAVILGVNPQKAGILAFELGADGSGAELLKLPAGGSKLPASAETVEKRLHFIKMNGSEVFKFAVKKIEESVNGLLEKAKLQPDDIDLYLFHQANRRIIVNSLERLALDIEKTFINIELYGNTSAASIPIALDEAIHAGKLKKGDKLLLSGFGAGLAWGGLIMEY
ncbi:beta-ketoacyl-ACP synthase III [Carboxydothermus ferrireducens]|uniref:Beta-ketoacyl-[acyl-carrier-protein] synthase III n=1 Tax=Carboxydothermus ferrireducens DSM 11255 TaxID=1119529 RepID=A0ABX2RAL8_9THEO|nr:beta-ketoacyl-ACP synthase III [Carboxydothermus ferrireducens]NYE58219.1 3-oxoacyl-[acyl-carrier-protein] synthase-3 [Carboxydothermus ferrireducens DSM 11255]